MKALSIIALIFAIISIFVPVVGLFIAMGCSVLALISFRGQPTIAGITFGVNIISTAFLSPSLVIASSAQGANGVGTYGFYVGFHVIAMLIAFIYFIIMKKRQKTA